MSNLRPIIQRPVGVPTLQEGSSVKGQSNRVQDQRVEDKGSSFAELLSEQLQKGQNIRFSKHAEQRLATRNVRLTGHQMQEISRAVDLADKKGIRDSLILMKDLAFIVNVPSKVVVTAMDGESIKNNVFTNIDGAVLI
jgi:flagellar operon protein